MNLAVYLCGEELAQQLNIESQKVLFGHNLYSKKGKTFVWPERFDESCLSPAVFLDLKNELKTQKIFIADRVFALDCSIIISNHINRSGKNFLRNKTPYGKRPTFFDASNVYSNKKGEKVTTVGPQRFKNKDTNEKRIISEKIAPISVLWHYIGIKITAIGLSDKTKNVTQLMKETEKTI
jgi:hypothetical protein